MARITEWKKIHSLKRLYLCRLSVFQMQTHKRVRNLKKTNQRR